jgi:hypothetical protein
VTDRERHLFNQRQRKPHHVIMRCSGIVYDTIDCPAYRLAATCNHAAILSLWWWLLKLFLLLFALPAAALLLHDVPVR